MRAVVPSTVAGAEAVPEAGSKATSWPWLSTAVQDVKSALQATPVSAWESTEWLA